MLLFKDLGLLLVCISERLRRDLQEVGVWVRVARQRYNPTWRNSSLLKKTWPEQDPGTEFTYSATAKI